MPGKGGGPQLSGLAFKGSLSSSRGREGHISAGGCRYISISTQVNKPSLRLLRCGLVSLAVHMQAGGGGGGGCLELLRPGGSYLFALDWSRV